MAALRRAEAPMNARPKPLSLKPRVYEVFIPLSALRAAENPWTLSGCEISPSTIRCTNLSVLLSSQKNLLNTFE